jgi:hypothetical protein
VIEPRLSITVPTAQDIPALMRNDQWITIESRSAQLVFIEQSAKIECGGAFNTTVPAELFELTRSRVPAIRAKAQRKQRPPYRLPAMSNEQEFERWQMIRGKAVTGSYVTKIELINYIEASFHTSLTYGWIPCFLQRRANEIRKAIVTPGELPKLQVSHGI